jgi:hypothetical protein
MRPLVVAALLLALAPAGAAAHFLPSSADLPGLEDRLADRVLTPVATSMSRSVVPPILQGATGKVEQIGHDPLRNRGMNAALAVHGGYAYVGYRSDGTHTSSGVLVVDVRNPAKPAVVHEIGIPNEGNPGESSRELRILPDKGLLLVLNHGCNELIHRCANVANTGASISRSNIRFYDITGENAAKPKLVSTYLPSRNGPQTPHEFFVWTDPEKPSRVLLYESTPSSEASKREQLIVVDISRARENTFEEIYKWTPVIGGDPGADVRLHSFTVSYDGRRMDLAYLGGGYLAADTTDLATGKAKPEIRLITPPENRVDFGDPGAHSAIKVPGKDFALVTDEVYGKFGGVLADHGCPWGWVRMMDTSDLTKPKLAAEYKLPVNEEKTCAANSQVRENFSSFAAHNPTLTSNLALITWHSAGFQIVDLSNPAQPKPAAEFMPQPLPFVETEDPALSQGEDKVVMWSFPVVVDGLIYVVDLRNGLYVLKYDGPHAEEVSSTRFLDGNSNSGDVRRFEFGVANADTTQKTAADGRPIPPALPERGCLASPLRLGTKGMGPIGLGIARSRVLLRTGPPVKEAASSARYCVDGGGLLRAAFARNGRTVLVATSSRRVTGRVRPGQSSRAVTRSSRRLGAGVYSLGGKRFATVRNGRVTAVGIAARSMLRRPGTVRRAVAGL